MVEESIFSLILSFPLLKVDKSWVEVRREDKSAEDIPRGNCETQQEEPTDLPNLQEDPRPEKVITLKEG